MWHFLKHKFLLPFLGICVDESTSQSFLVSPYMRNGNLRQWREKVNPPMAEIQKRVWFLLLWMIMRAHSTQDTGSCSRS